MSKESRSKRRVVGPRGKRLVLVGLGVLVMAALGALSVMGIVTMFMQGHPLRAAFLTMAPLLLLLLTSRIIAVNWRPEDPASDPEGAPDGTDVTGNWGVGGPSMREPGSTGVWPARNVDRRYEERDD
jgi:3-oxoacyl-(acyl-carrier-protein) synthase